MQDLISNIDDSKIMSAVKKEFKKIKIEGKRQLDNNNPDSEENKTYFVNNKNCSRYDSWKGSRDFKDFKRTGSNNWRTHSGNRWRKSQSLAGSGSRPRSVSWSGDKSNEFRSLKDFQSMVLKEIKSLKEKQEKILKTQEDMMSKVVDSKYIEADYVEVDWSNENMKIYFTSNIDDVDEMVVDCGAPKTLIRDKHLKEYMRHHKLTNNDLEIYPCKQRFKFGPSQTFISKEKAIIPICLVEAFVIKAHVPFLLGNMKHWRVLLDMESEEMEFRMFGINVGMSRNAGGHLEVPLQKVEEWSTAETVLFMKKEDQICTFEKIMKIQITNQKRTYCMPIEKQMF